MIFTVVDFGSPQFDETLSLRNDILRKPLGIEFHIEDIQEEYNQHHLACYGENYELLGCLVMKDISATKIKMRQVAVSEKHQNKGIGKRLVAFSEEWSLDNGYKSIELNARKVAVPFYLKLDYNTKGKEFKEVDIPHFKMTKKLG